MVATVLRLRYRILGNMLARSPWQLVGFVFGAIGAAGGLAFAAFALAVIGVSGLEAVRGVATVGGALLVVGWCVAPLIAGGIDTTIGPEQLAPFPMSTRRMMVALAVVGLAGISRDLKADESSHPAYSRLAAVVQSIQANYVQPLNLKQLAAMADMSVAQLERYFHKVFHLTPRQVLLKARLDAATALLVSHDKVTDVAALCGYTDHSAFTRQFKATVGVTPTEYRMLLHGTSRS